MSAIATNPQFKRTVLRLLGIHNPEHPIILRAQKLRRALMQTDKRMIESYLHDNAVPKLQIGGGWRSLDGWLNVDIAAISDVVQMDATKPFPFADGQFRYVYSEHMIEHVDYNNGLSMLHECYRVMLKGGTIRIVTPNLANLAGLCHDDLTGREREYLDFLCNGCLTNGEPRTPASVINAFFRLWGHRFLYDKATLHAALTSAGFRDIRRYCLHESDTPALRGLEHVERYPDGFLDLESIALEATKPAKPNS